MPARAAAWPEPSLQCLVVFYRCAVADERSSLRDGVVATLDSALGSLDGQLARRKWDHGHEHLCRPARRVSCLDWVMERHLHGGQAQGNKGEHHAILGHAGASSCLARTVLAVPGGVLPLCRRRRAQQSSGWSRGHTYQRSRVSGWPAGTWEVGSRLRAPVLACTKSEGCYA
ncbi:uncharacterized protein LOC144115083 isoform X4 [Amblyomma americanum]